MEPDDELLEYETEHDADDGTPVPVCISEPVVAVPAVPQHTTAYMVTVDPAGDRWAELLSLDPLRARAVVVVSGEPVLLCHSLTMAQRGQGAPLPVGVPVELTAIAPVWVAATETAAGPAFVGVVAERRSAEP